MRIQLLFSMLITMGINMVSAQCVDQEAHNTSIISHWLSCEISTNPLTSLADGHWIMYEFEEAVGIEKMTIWNLNHPDFLSMGAQEVRLDYSPDGAIWNTLGSVQVEPGDGGPDYVGVEMEDLPEFDAQYVLLSVISNHGGPCTGLAEVKFQLGSLTTSNEEIVVNQLKAWPNPADQLVSIDLGEWRDRVSQYQVVDQLGRIIAADDVSRVSDNGVVSLSTVEFSSGPYVVSFRGAEAIVNQSLVVFHP